MNTLLLSMAIQCARRMEQQGLMWRDVGWYTPTMNIRWEAYKQDHPCTSHFHADKRCSAGGWEIFADVVITNAATVPLDKNGVQL